MHPLTAKGLVRLADGTIDGWQFLNIACVVSAADLGNRIAQLKHMLLNKSETLSDGDICRSIGQAGITAAAVGAIGKVPVWIPEEGSDCVCHPISQQLMAGNGRAIVATVALGRDSNPDKISNLGMWWV